MDCGFGDNVGVEAVAEIDGVDVVTAVGSLLVSSLNVHRTEHNQAKAICD